MWCGAYDLDVTTSSPETVDAINDYTIDWTGYRTRLKTIMVAAEVLAQRHSERPVVGTTRRVLEQARRGKARGDRAQQRRRPFCFSLSPAM